MTFQRLSILVCLLLSAASYRADAQIVRPPDLKLQYHRAERAWRSGSSLEEARVRLDRVLTNLPDDTEARLLRAQVLLALGDVDGSVEDAIRSVREWPESGETHLVLCEALLAADRPAEARNSLDDAAERIISGTSLHIRLSDSALALNLLDRAEAYARIAVAGDDRLPGAYRQLAHVFMAQSRPDDAAMILTLGLESGILMPAAVQADSVLTPLTSLPALSRWYDR